jgi:peptidoglycan/LPS O-acetylase OafA/YrhL
MNEILNGVAMYLTCWFGILTLLGFAKIGFNQNNKLTRYLTQRSFSIYLFHFLWVVLFQFSLSKVTDNTVVLVLATVTGSFFMTLVTCEVIRRIPVVKFLYGIKKI